MDDLSEGEPGPSAPKRKKIQGADSTTSYLKSSLIISYFLQPSTFKESANLSEEDKKLKVTI